MTKVNFRTSDFQRQVADAGELVLKNRYFEQNPFLTDDGASMVARPGMRRLTYVGTGPIRGLKTEAGSFNGDLFIASGEELYRMDNKLNQTFIFSGLFNPDRGVINMAITGSIGDGPSATPAYCFVADGRNLFVYIENGYASNTLTGTPVNNDTVTIGTYTYQWTNGSVDTGTPDGSSGNPWLVNIGVTPGDAFNNLYNAVNATGVAGTDYSTDLQQSPDAKGIAASNTLFTVRATAVGALGNDTVTTETGSGVTWTNTGTMTGGGNPSFTQVDMPDDVGAIDCAVINSYVIVIPVQDDDFQGRFYWVNPGETTVNPINFATAERSPDAVFGVQVFQDQFWLPGQTTTEVWYVNPNQALDGSSSAMLRLQGVVYDRGSWQDTAKAIHEQMMIVDENGGVFIIQGGTPRRVSTPDIEEEIRRAMAIQNNYPLPL